MPEEKRVKDGEMLNSAQARWKTRLRSEGRALQAPRGTTRLRRLLLQPSGQREGSQMAKKEGIVKTPIFEDTYHIEGV